MSHLPMKKRRYSTTRFSALSVCSARALMSMSLTMVVAALEQFVVFVAAGNYVGDQIEDFLARQLIQQALGHDGGVGLFLFGDIRFLYQNRLRLGERVFDHLERV